MEQAQKSDHDRLAEFVKGYTANVIDGFEERWSQVTPEIFAKHIHECIGGLLARQATLSIELANSPSIWNGDVAPLILRCMIDAYITLAWILGDPADRTVKYIHYGLGQEKLFVAYLEEELNNNPDGYDSEAMRKMIQLRKDWLNSQRAEWATEVNVGSWSGISTREMAKEIGRESIYRFAYVPFSGPTHNMWQHVGIYNMKPCTNPLHKRHLVPMISNPLMHPDFMYRSAKYLSLTYELVDENLGTKSDQPLPVDYFVEHDLFFDDEDAGKGENS